MIEKPVDRLPRLLYRKDRRRSITKLSPLRLEVELSNQNEPCANFGRTVWHNGTLTAPRR